MRRVSTSDKPDPTPTYGRALTNLGWWCFLALLTFFSAFFVYTCEALGKSPNESRITRADYASEDQVELWIRWFLRGVKKGKRWKGAQELAGLITRHANAPAPILERSREGGIPRVVVVELNPIDPLLVAVNFSLESSFVQTSRGAVGELGLPQIHPKNKKALTKTDGSLYDMDSREGQVAAGVRWLAYELQRCQTLEAGLTAYKYGACRPIKATGRYRAAEYRRARRIVGLD